ncbi:IS110 family transposase [Sphingobium sp. SA916]|uniref:IS110 family transposase n=1 Tax=Sphingobium sp. SA916 TaxID=1851207 RepID=UPI001C0F2766|nr:IS110 family transposase [Sphingobium sp. SA916]
MITVEARVHPLVQARALSKLPNLLGNGDAPMSYDYHIGVDYHKAYTHLVVQDGGGKVLRSGKVKNDPRSLAGFLSPYLENSHAVMEASRNWTVMYDWLDELCDDVILAHPLKVKAIADAKIKTDKIDATILAHLLRADLIPESYVPCEAARALRQALRERIFFVRLRTMVKNRVVTIFDRYPEQTRALREMSDQFGKIGRGQLELLSVSVIDREHIDRALAFIDDINQRIRESEKTIRCFSKDNADVKRLKTIPGVGEFFARLIAAEIDDISRFRSAKKLAAYAGLVPSTYASGGKCWNGRIIKAGNKWLRWAFVEASIPAMRAEPALKFDYERLKATKGANRAKVIVGRKLLTIAYQVLRDQRDYERRDALVERPSNSSRLS